MWRPSKQLGYLSYGNVDSDGYFQMEQDIQWGVMLDVFLCFCCAHPGCWWWLASSIKVRSIFITLMTIQLDRRPPCSLVIHRAHKKSENHNNLWAGILISFTWHETITRPGYNDGSSVDLASDWSVWSLSWPLISWWWPVTRDTGLSLERGGFLLWTEWTQNQSSSSTTWPNKLLIICFISQIRSSWGKKAMQRRKGNPEQPSPTPRSLSLRRDSFTRNICLQQTGTRSPASWASQAARWAICLISRIFIMIWSKTLSEILD